MSDLFVSYKAEDRKRVKPLVDALEADGFSVWWDEHIGGGAAWRQTIEAELNIAKCVLAIWSKRSVGPEGTFVQDEAARAQQRHVYVPVLIDRVRAPLGFGGTQALPLTSWTGDRSDPRYQAVLAAAARILDVDRCSAERRPAAAFRVTRRSALVAGGAVSTLAVAGISAWALLKSNSGVPSDSIAVLPFANLSGDPRQTYFSDGIAEELRSALGRVAGLQVVGRISSEAVRNNDAETAATKLRVANVLTGSVRQSLSTIRVSAQLIDGRNGMERWSENYDRAPGDAIKIQTDIAENVARALSITLGSAGREAIAIGRTNDAGAQDQYLKAVAVYISGHGRPTLEQTIALLDSAIRLDPDYAEAYALRAHAVDQLTGGFSGSGNWVRGFSEAESDARKAIALSPTLAAGHVALARVLLSRFDVLGALREFQTAAQTGSNDPNFLMEYSSFLTQLGFARKALPLARRTIDLDPLNPRAILTEGGALFSDKRYEEAIAVANRVLALSPNRPDAHKLIGSSLTMLGRTDEAREHYSRLPTDDFFRLTYEAILDARTGDRQASDRSLAKMRQLFGDSAAYQYAQIHAQRGETQEALGALERAFAIRDPGVSLAKGDPWLDPLRGDRRFTAFLKKVGFPG